LSLATGAMMKVTIQKSLSWHPKSGKASHSLVSWLRWREDRGDLG
jgi:hypothetical protein